MVFGGFVLSRGVLVGAVERGVVGGGGLGLAHLILDVFDFFGDTHGGGWEGWSGEGVLGVCCLRGNWGLLKVSGALRWPEVR